MIMGYRIVDDTAKYYYVKKNMAANIYEVHQVESVNESKLIPVKSYGILAYVYEIEDTPGRELYYSKKNALLVKEKLNKTF